MASNIKRLWLHDEDNTIRVNPITTLDNIKIQPDQTQDEFESFENDYNDLKNRVATNRTVADNSISSLNSRVTALENGGGGGGTSVEGLATTTANGLMSKEDKIKLNGISDEANRYVLPQASTDVMGGIKIDGTTITIDENGVAHSTGGTSNVSKVSDLSDVHLVSLKTGDTLVYNVSTNRWENREGSGSEVNVQYVSFYDIVDLFDTDDDDYTYDLSLIY